MSLSNIRSLMQQDTTLRLPNIASWAAESQRVVSIVAVQAHKEHIHHIAMLHINTAGEIQWTVDSVGIPENLVQSKKDKPTSYGFNNKLTWRQGWAQAFRNIASHHTIVCASTEDLDLLKKQFSINNMTAPGISHAVILREEYRKSHPHKNVSLVEMAKFYQVPLDPERPIKAMAVTYARLLEKILGYKTPDTQCTLHLNAPVSETDLDRVRKLVLRAANTEKDCSSFFESLSHECALLIAHNKKRILGFSLQIQGRWYKGSDLHDTLSWPHLSQERQWNPSSQEIAKLDFLYNDNPTS